MQINVDYTLCDGHGQCLLAAPDIFDLPDGSDQVVVLNPDPPEHDRAAVLRAMAMCPAQALQVVEQAAPAGECGRRNPVAHTDFA